jgi:cyclopropane fatty-acyl-phospholipid synthase-like methyltransferase
MGSIGDGGELTYLEKGVQDAEKFRKLREKIDESDAAVEEAILQLDIQEGQTILDFGCGEGTLLTRYVIPALAAKKDTKLVGLEISENMIEAAKIHNADPRIEYICGDIFSKESSPLAGRKFDKIVSVWVLDYFTDYA